MEPLKKPILRDIDGTVPGKVQLVCIRLAEELPRRDDYMHTYFEEKLGDERDPWLRAEGLYESLKKDWPEHEWAIVGNWRARYLVWRRHQQSMGFLSEKDWTPQAYLDSK